MVQTTEKRKRGRKSLDKDKLSVTLDNDLLAVIRQYPEGERSEEVNKRLRQSFGLPEKQEVK